MLNKSWKADIKFEALYESAYKQKVDSEFYDSHWDIDSFGDQQ